MPGAMKAVRKPSMKSATSASRSSSKKDEPSIEPFFEKIGAEVLG